MTAKERINSLDNKKPDVADPTPSKGFAFLVADFKTVEKSNKRILDKETESYGGSSSPYPGKRRCRR